MKTKETKVQMYIIHHDNETSSKGSASYIVYTSPDSTFAMTASNAF